jgi:hypothetical protein
MAKRVLNQTAPGRSAVIARLAEAYGQLQAYETGFFLLLE